MLRSNMTANRGEDGVVTLPADHLAEPVTPHQPPLLDLGKIAEMESLIGKQAIANMLNMMRADIVELIPIMIDDLIAGKFEQARQAAHRLKGAASLLGVPRLADGLARLEKMTIDGGDIHYVINYLRQVATDTLRAIADRD